MRPRKQVARVSILTGVLLLTPNGIGWAQAPRVQAEDPVISAARQAAAVYAQSLPDYIVKRTTTRYTGARQSMHLPSGNLWRELDTVSADLASEHGEDVYTNVMRNGKPSPSLPTRGAWSWGEFSSQILAILPLERAARFTHPREESVRNRSAVRYDYVVDEAHSDWHLSAGHLPGAPAVSDCAPAYGGSIWIDRRTNQAVKIQQIARKLPGRFPLDTVESVTDYDFVRIGQSEYLLPTHSETISCQRDSTLCFRNQTDFRDYDKFSSNTNISFDNNSKAEQE